MTEQRPGFYDELAEWWPLFSPPEHYREEAADLLPRLGRPGPADAATLLELGSGGGSLASHLKAHFTMTLTNRSEGMLAVSRTVNPECEHLVGDMRTLRLDRRFDAVLIHDAIMYATEPGAVRVVHDRHVEGLLLGLVGSSGSRRRGSRPKVPSTRGEGMCSSRGPPEADASPLMPRHQ